MAATGLVRRPSLGRKGFADGRENNKTATATATDNDKDSNDKTAATNTTNATTTTSNAIAPEVAEGFGARDEGEMDAFLQRYVLYGDGSVKHVL